MDRRVLLVFHGTAEQREPPQMRKIQFNTIWSYTPDPNSWDALIHAGIQKRERELRERFRYDRCIAVHNDSWNDRIVQIMATAFPTDSRIVLSEQVWDATMKEQGLQGASPHLFSADSRGFARMCEFGRGFRFDPPSHADLSIERRFYQHIHAMGYHAMGGP